MAITNRERVGKSIDQLRAGLTPFVERELTNAFNNRFDVALSHYARLQSWGEIARLTRCQSQPKQALLFWVVGSGSRAGDGTGDGLRTLVERRDRAHRRCRRADAQALWRSEDRSAACAGAAALLEYLIEIGVLRRRPDGRLDAPDLYLSGLGLRRKGGVRRRA